MVVNEGTMHKDAGWQSVGVKSLRKLAAIALVFASIFTGSVYPARSAGETAETTQAQPVKSKLGLVMPVKAEQTLQLAHTKLVCGKGTLVFFLRKGQDIAVFNLNSKRKGDVKVTVGSSTIRPLPGEEIVVTSNLTSEFADVNPGKLISFRKPKLSHQGENLRVFTADFSIASAVLSIKQLQAMLHSDDPYQRHLINEVLKNHAIWSDTANADGPYSQPK
jgi:hypothetical protein